MSRWTVCINIHISLPVSLYPSHCASKASKYSILKKSGLQSSMLLQDTPFFSCCLPSYSRCMTTHDTCRDDSGIRRIRSIKFSKSIRSELRSTMCSHRNIAAIWPQSLCRYLWGRPLEQWKRQAKAANGARSRIRKGWWARWARWAPVLWVCLSIKIIKIVKCWSALVLTTQNWK